MPKALRAFRPYIDIIQETLELITLNYRANSKTEKHDTLQLAREKIEVIRLFIRLMKDLKQISLYKFVRINKQVENVSKQFDPI